MNNIDNNLMREYDGLIGLTLLNLYTISKENKTIRLYHFDRKNKEHMYLLRIALMARDLYQFPVEVEGTRWEVACLNWKLRKGFNKVKRYKPIRGEGIERLYQHGEVHVPELLNFMRGDGITRCGENFTFADIYEVYYERSK